VNAATGALADWLTVTVWLAEVEPAALVAFSVTVKVPDVAKAWVGFWLVLVPPSPKVQAHAVGELVEASMKVTVAPMTGVLGEKLKAATGAFWVDGLVALDPPPLQPRKARLPKVTAQARMMRIGCIGSPGVTRAANRLCLGLGTAKKNMGLFHNRSLSSL